jgi:cyclase
LLAKRIIPCLDIKDGIVVKGIKYKNLRTSGDPVELAQRYEDEGADELVFLDITASHEKRAILLDIVEKTADCLSIPFTVGGGIRTVEDIREVLCAGADKIAINSAAVKNPQVLQEGAEIFGSQCIVLALDAKRKNTSEKKENGWEIYIHGGRIATGIDAVAWAKKGEQLGAGELLPTSMDCDGTKNGYDLELYRSLAKETNIPIIASGGAGDTEQIYEVLTKGKADAALAASIFHYDILPIPELKRKLAQRGLPIRI